jgi:hypothetical protein
MNKFIMQLSMKDHQLMSYMNALKHVGAEYHFYSIYSNTNLIDNLPDNFVSNDYIAFATIKALKLSKELTPEHFGSEELYQKYASTYQTAFFYEDADKFDQKYYKNLGLPLLNGSCDVIDLADNLDRTFDREVFIKPTSDLKGYIGGIIPVGTTIYDFLMKGSYMPHWKSETTLVAEVKDIYSEYRFFVVGNRVITGSRYMLNKEVNASVDIPAEVQKMAVELAKVYQPDKVFTMDLALLHNGSIEIVEYNCFNGSGTYLAPLEDLMKELMVLNLTGG